MNKKGLNINSSGSKKSVGLTIKTPGFSQFGPKVVDNAGSIVASIPSGDQVIINLHGATITSWTTRSTDGEDVENIWLSHAAKLDGSAPIRGGVPIVFPVFGPPPKEGHATSVLKQHGFARNATWEYFGKSTSELNEQKHNASASKEDNASASKKESASASEEDSIRVDFSLSNDKLPEALQKQWPMKFALIYSVTLSPKKLKTMLTVRNTSETTDFQFQALLHSYFRVKDATSAKVAGLMGVEYVDKVLDATSHNQTEEQIAFSGEVDRVYSKIPQDTTSILEHGKSRFDIKRIEVTDTVVWNPWKEKAVAMGDFEPKDGYKNMICVEVGSVKEWVTVKPEGLWEGGQEITSHID